MFFNTESYNVKKLQGISSALQNKICILKVRSTLNNIYVTITNNFGKIIFVGSGGSSKVSSKRNTNYNLELLLDTLGKKLLSLNIKNLILTLDFSSLRKKKILIKILQKFHLKVLGVQLIVNKAFNGVRPSKKRRV
uniref:30S ribosomal protein 11 n=1 Tax=Polymyxa betae TaxID=41456 RepID=UPI001D0FC348|nr:30S ribosomal protein 11 [Polymyxa betae]CAG9644856.1 30S ribosomal protein 11 [Polymyxa betae]